MKIMIDVDLSSGMSLENFHDTLKIFEDKEYDIKIVCRGLPGRYGDEYEFLREGSNRHEVVYTEGIPPSLYLPKHLGWTPDVIISRPQYYKDSVIFNNPEVMI